MARVVTIDQILKEMKGGAMSPKGSGAEAYAGIEAGTHEDFKVIDHDDLSKGTIDLATNYLARKTRGQVTKEEQNTYSLSSTSKKISLVSPGLGTPAPLSNIPNSQASFENSDAEGKLDEAFNIFDSLGFFKDLEGDDGPKLNKNNQIDGHSVLNKNETKEKVSNVLNSNRFSSMNTPNKKFTNLTSDNNFDFLDEDGNPKDINNIKKLKKVALWVMRNQDLAKSSFPDAGINPDNEESPNSFGQRGNLEFGKLSEDTGSTKRKVLKKQKEAKAKGKTLYGVPNTPEEPYGSSNLTAIAAMSKFLLVDLKLSLFGILGFLESTSKTISDNNNYTGTFSKIAYYPVKLSNAELVALTENN